MKHVVLILVLLALVPLTSNAKSEYKVTYISSDHVYIDGGKVDGLNVSDRLRVSNDVTKKMALEIVYVSNHSASCSLIDTTVTLKPGDLLVVAFSNSDNIKKSKSGDGSSITNHNVEPKIITNPTNAPLNVSGNVSIILYQWFDNSESNLDFTQSSARVNLTAANIFRENLTLSLRTRGRYDIRTKAYDGGAPETSWENRLWEFSLTYYEPNSSLSYGLGRILPRKLGGVGYLDGAMIDIRTSQNVSFGLLGGKQPDWLYSSSQESVTKFGIYSEFKSDRNASNQIRFATGLVEELHSGEVSRTYVASSGHITFNRQFGFSHSSELDINSGWRKERAGYSLTLSNLYLRAYFQIGPKIRTSVSFDKRKNYWTYVYRSLPDSLFNDNINHGLRGTIDYNPAKNLWLSGSLGYRKHNPGEDPTISFSGRTRVSRLLGKDASVSLYFSGFDGPFEHGINYRIGFDVGFRKIGSITSGISNYIYAVNEQNQSRSTRSIDFGILRDISRNYYIGSNVHSDYGDDIQGLRVQFEFGYRY